MERTLKQESIDEEYRQLRQKVQSQIKYLENQLTKDSQIHYHRQIHSHLHSHSQEFINIPSKIQSRTAYNPQKLSGSQPTEPQPCCCHCNHFPNHNCHSYLCSRTINQNSRENILNGITVRTSRNNTKTFIIDHDLSQLPKERNSEMQKVLLKSLQNQEKLSTNIKILNQKLQKLSGSKQNVKLMPYQCQNEERHAFFPQNPRGYSLTHDRGFSSSNLREGSLVTKWKQVPLKQRQIRKSNFSESDYGSKSKRTFKNKKKGHRKSKKSVSDPQNEYFFNSKKSKPKGPSLKNLPTMKGKIDPKVKENWYLEYFGGHVCPMHSQLKRMKIKSKEMQVYKDSYFGNRKHERDHLMESFKQQKLAKQRLIEKVLQHEDCRQVRIK